MSTITGEHRLPATHAKAKRKRRLRFGEGVLLTIIFLILLLWRADAHHARAEARGSTSCQQ